MRFFFILPFFIIGLSCFAQDEPVLFDSTASPILLEEVKKPIDFSMSIGMIQNFNRPGLTLPAVNATTFIENWGFTYQYDIFLGEHSAGLSYLLFNTKRREKYYIIKE